MRFVMVPFGSRSRSPVQGRVEQKLAFEAGLISGLLALERLQPCRQRFVPLCGWRSHILEDALNLARKHSSETCPTRS